MTVLRRPTLIAATLAAGLIALTGCSSSTEASSDSSTSAAATPETVTITDNHGEVEVPYQPERVVALDNHVLQTLSDWDVELVAAAKGLMGTGIWPEYQDDEAILDVGTHREPDLEQVIAAEPDLIIGGSRFGDYYDQLSEIATTIETEPQDDELITDGLIRQVTTLGEIFGKQDEAQELTEALETATAEAKDAYDGSSTALGLITSGGEISYAAPGSGRSVGPVFTALDLVPAIETEAEDATHGDDISLEAIAQANPDWLIVLDRDGALDTEGYVAAQELIEGSELLANVTAVQEGQVIYLDPNFYLTEDIQAYTALFEQIRDAFSA
ncbi:ABC transporter substrate-binding protein [Cellulomonas sp. NPDC089187]|uniref:siderophore ABC transporter substrate-binding protein n=1 Tax=Cellulomonas sp. NPDC089187 TaxID=3154970 RepID=UPI00343D422D